MKYYSSNDRAGERKVGGVLLGSVRTRNMKEYGRKGCGPGTALKSEPLFKLLAEGPCTGAFRVV